MKLAQCLAYGVDDRIEALLRETTATSAAWLKPVRHPSACLSVLQKASAGVLVLKLGRNLDQEFTLLEQVSRLYPETAVVVVGHVEGSALASLAWDLGAGAVLFPPQPIEKLTDIVGAAITAPA
jgi:DNA-binding NarL/FixJ family response regulator